MSEHTERWVLNHLIETCRDGERGFRHAANLVTNPPVKSLFLEIASQRERFAADLLPHAHRLGGAMESDGTTAGALHRGWMSIKDTLTGHDESGIIHEAERGEDAAAAAYRDALDGMVPPSTRDLIERQYEEIRTTHDRVRAFLVPQGS